ncbi:MAG: hypothetical protein AAGH41_09480 [Pseudomonadota bacterium]
MRRSLLALTAFLAACGTIEPPNDPPTYTPPPDVATEGLIPILVEATLPFDLEGTRAYAVRNPIVNYFEESDGIAPPESSEILQGTWGEAGAVRRIKLTDGHYLIERIIENTPELFTYQIWIFTNEAGRGVEQIVGIQRFTEVSENETAFSWSYKVKPKNALTAIFVRRQLPALQNYLQSAVDGWSAAAREGVSTASAE